MAAKKTAAPAKMAPESDRAWKARSALDTLTRAQEIQKDARLMRDVKALAKDQSAQLAKLAGKGR